MVLWWSTSSSRAGSGFGEDPSCWFGPCPKTKAAGWRSELKKGQPCWCAQKTIHKGPCIWVTIPVSHVIALHSTSRLTLAFWGNGLSHPSLLQQAPRGQFKDLRHAVLGAGAQLGARSAEVHRAHLTRARRDVQVSPIGHLRWLERFGIRAKMGGVLLIRL